MKWFKKLFRGKSEKPSESNWKIQRFDSKSYVQEKCPPTVSKEVNVAKEVYALTTIRNFRSDSIDAFVLESEWVLVSKVELMEPKFQERLSRMNTLTELCKKSSKSKCRNTTVIAKPSGCHCADLEKQEKEETQRTNPFWCLLKKICDLWKCLRKKIKRVFCKNDEVIAIDESDFEITNSYLCR